MFPKFYLDILKQLLYILVLLPIIFSCKEKKEQKKELSGVIKYSIKYPKLFGNADDNLMRMFLPKHMEMSYKGDLFKTEIKNGNVFGTSFIGNSADKSMRAGTNYFTAKNKCYFTEDEKNIYLKSQPVYQIVKTDKTKKILHFNTKHAFAINQTSNDTVDLFYTDEIKIKNMNWFTAFHEIDGVLLEYEIERYGMKMKFEAVEVYDIDSTNTFDYPNDFKELNYKDYDSKIKGYFDDIKK